MTKIVNFCLGIMSALLLTSCTLVTAHDSQIDTSVNEKKSDTIPAFTQVESGYEIPQIKSRKTVSQIVQHKGFSLSFNCDTRCANWVAWHLTKEEVENKIVKRSNFFAPDTTLPEDCQVQHYDYKGSGYDRGHMVPAGDMRWDKQAMDDCFLMSNMCPQHHDLNEGDWNSLEDACRRWAKAEGEIYIACGPIYEKDREPFRISDRRIAVPDYFYKVVMVLTPGKERAIGFIFQNDTGVQFMKDSYVTVDEIEKITDIDFFYSVPKDIQNRIESEADFKKWNY